jgi:phosphoribosyl-ATP pyrophosphohydrolase/phosphoribosyl-AMP cyclohydrolase
MANILEMVKYNADGLIPAITQDIRTDEVLMLAYMNEASLRKTIDTGLAHYYSRSRRKLWLKGETSGHYQKVRSISVDCDGDTLLLKVEQTGAACHTGHRSCFFTRLEADALKAGADMVPDAHDGGDARTDTGACGPDHRDAAAVTDSTAVSAGSSGYTADSGENDSVSGTAGPEVLAEVFGVICDRLKHPKEGSYTNYLFTKGLDKILKKVGEETSEVIIAAKNGDAGEISAEIADLFYHIMVLLAQRGMTLNNIYEELKKRE